MATNESLRIGMTKTQAEVMTRAAASDHRRAYVNENPRNIVIVSTSPFGSRFVEMWESAQAGLVDNPDMKMQLMAAFSLSSWNFEWMGGQS